MGLTARVVREVYRREAIPVSLRWLMTAQAMRDYFRLLARALRPHVEDSRQIVAELAAETWRRRFEVLSQQHALPSAQEHDMPLLMSGLYLLQLQPRCQWIAEAAGGVPRTAAEHLRAVRLLGQLTVGDRWREVSVHLGEMLIVSTETLPARVPRARQIVADMCHEMGVRYAAHMRRVLDLDDQLPVANAIEILRTSEYLFRVNPEHHSAADEAARTGYIDGNACPWYVRPGWQQLHCGIFGQFQAGVCSAFGLKYRLTTTIPKHGGDHCRVDLEPIKLRRSRDGLDLAS